MLNFRFLPLLGLILVLGAPSGAANLVMAPDTVWEGKGKKGDGDPPRPKPAPGPREGGDDD